MSVSAQALPQEEQTAEEAKKAAQAVWDELEAEDNAAAAGEQPAPEGESAAPESVEPQKQAQVAETKPEEVKASPFSDEERALLRQIPEVMSLVKSTVGRVGSLQSELAKMGKAAAADSAGEAPTSREIDKAATNPQAWDRLKTDFPDWAEGVEAFVSTRIPSASAPKIDFDVEVNSRLQKTREEDAMEMVSLFDDKWQEKAATPQFAEWLRAQPADYQKRAVDTWKPSEILRTIRDFDAATEAKKQPEPTPKPKGQRLANAAIPRPSGKPTIVKPVDQMDPKEYWAHLEAEDAQKERAAR